MTSLVCGRLAAGTLGNRGCVWLNSLRHQESLFLFFGIGECFGLLVHQLYNLTTHILLVDNFWTISPYRLPTGFQKLLERAS